MKAKDGKNEIGLNHICFAPVVEAGLDVGEEECAIMNPWGWFKNDVEILDENEPGETYFDRLIECFM